MDPKDRDIVQSIFAAKYRHYAFDSVPVTGSLLHFICAEVPCHSGPAYAVHMYLDRALVLFIVDSCFAFLPMGTGCAAVSGHHGCYVSRLFIVFVGDRYIACRTLQDGSFVFIQFEVSKYIIGEFSCQRCCHKLDVLFPGKFFEFGTFVCTVTIQLHCRPVVLLLFDELPFHLYVGGCVGQEVCIDDDAVAVTVMCLRNIQDEAVMMASFVPVCNGGVERVLDTVCRNILLVLRTPDPVIPKDGLLILDAEKTLYSGISSRNS